jgi:hypothetical protein
MKRKATLDLTLDPLIQTDAKAAFRQLQLQINGLARDRRSLRHGLDDYTPTPVGLDLLVAQAKRLRRELEYWSNLVSGHHPVRLIDISIRLHNKLSMIESDLEWDQEVLVGNFNPRASGHMAN